MSSASACAACQSTCELPDRLTMCLLHLSQPHAGTRHSPRADEPRCWWPLPSSIHPRQRRSLIRHRVMVGIASPALPAPATPLVARDEHVVQIRQRLLHGDGRLLTLTGPAGTGKTRLALAAAAGLVQAY